MRRFALMLALLSVTALAGSAIAQDTTAKRDTATRDTTHKRVHHVTSKGEVDSASHPKPKLDTAKIHEPTRADSSLARHEMRADTSSILRDTTARPHTPPPQKQPPPPPPPPPPDSQKPAKPTPP
jgi:hypothetical protein